MATTDGGAGAIEAIEATGGLGGARLVVLCDVRPAGADAPRGLYCVMVWREAGRSAHI